MIGFRPALYRESPGILTGRLVELPGNSAENGEGFRGRGLERKPGAAKTYQIGSRNPHPPDAFAFFATIFSVGSFGAFL